MRAAAQFCQSLEEKLAPQPEAQVLRGPLEHCLEDKRQSKGVLGAERRPDGLAATAS